ncbi:MAG: hypothetical protein M1824_000588 [Vezdaea acicularis]|nr:MAG: hypothetical protein M1824_000588 [Vezdaea acicularis]
MAPTYKIAVIQLHPKPLQVAHNYAKAETLIRAAAASGAELAVLPEYHLTNWLPSSPSFLSAVVESSSYLSKYQLLASSLSISIVPGTLISRHTNPETGASELRNTAYYIDPHGTILGQYTKKNLWHPERPHLHSSAHAPHELIPNTPFGPIGLLICWDLAFPEAFRALISAGAKIIIIPSFWTLFDCSPAGLALNPRAEELFLNSTLTARAFENTCCIVFVNAAGPEEKGYCGLSQVTLPFIGPLGDGPMGHEEGFRVLTVDMEVLEEAERNYRVREDLGREDWWYGYERRRDRDKGKL